MLFFYLNFCFYDKLRQFLLTLSTRSLVQRNRRTLARRSLYGPRSLKGFERLEGRRLLAFDLAEVNSDFLGERSANANWVYESSNKSDVQWIHQYKTGQSILNIRSKIQHHNFVLPFDVDSNGMVEPQDVLIVINELNRARSSDESVTNSTVSNSVRLYFYDVNSNGITDPIDVLQIINRLNRPAPNNSDFKGVYFIGNSLSVDAIYNYQGAYQFSIQCNQNLQTIFDTPSGTCPGGESNPNAVRWDAAFSERSYEFVSVQPFYFTTLDQNVEIISTWMKLQPDSKFILHSGWPNLSATSVYHQSLDPNEQFVHSKSHIDALTERIRDAFPGRGISNTNIIGTIESIRQDIAAGTSPIASLNELYRDPVHFDALGQYIATNSIYVAMGRTIDESILVERIAPVIRNYLNPKIVANVKR